MNSIESYSQSFQDVFATKICKENRTFVEIGAARPKLVNNSYLLDKLGWKGFSIELSSKFAKNWDDALRSNHRTTKFYHDNALTFDYFSAVQENNLPIRLGYLSCDIEPAKNTFDALKRILSQGLQFDCITFEHDLYQEKTDFNTQSKDFLSDYGYKVAVELVTDHLNNHYETWFVNNDINFEKCSYEFFKKNILNT